MLPHYLLRGRAYFKRGRPKHNQRKPLNHKDARVAPADSKTSCWALLLSMLFSGWFCSLQCNATPFELFKRTVQESHHKSDSVLDCVSPSFRPCCARKATAEQQVKRLAVCLSLLMLMLLLLLLLLPLHSARVLAMDSALCNGLSLVA